MRASLLLILGVTVFASFAADGGLKATVTASGSAEVLPTELHVVLTFKQKAPDAKAAFAALKTARETALAKLPGIDPAKAREETPTVIEKPGSNPLQAAMAGARGNRLKRKANDDAPEVILQQIVRVPVTLSGKDLLAITLEAESMKAAVHAVKPIPDQPDAEEDPDGTAAYTAVMAGGPKPRNPVEFEYVAPRTPELEQKAYAAALKTARAKAGNLAVAAGLKTAEPVSVTLQETDKEESGMAGAMTYYRIMMGLVSTAKTSDVVSGDTAALAVKVSLVVECMLK